MNLLAWFWRQVDRHLDRLIVQALASGTGLDLGQPPQVTRETTPIHDRLWAERIREAAGARTAEVGDSDLAEWDREVRWVE